MYKSIVLCSDIEYELFNSCEGLILRSETNDLCHRSIVVIIDDSIFVFVI